MSSGELTEWAAFESLYGPILAHDRIDIGLAQVCTILARLLAKRSKHTVRDFLPAWWQDSFKRASRGEDNVLRGFEALMEMAENADD